MDYENAKESINDSLAFLKVDYLDLVLVHWPTSLCGEPGESGRLETWRALEEYKESGKVKSIGVSNFLVRHLESMIPKVKYAPVVNQMEIHPLY